MSLTSHLSQLRQKHETLSRKLEEAHKHPSVAALELAALKRQKLVLKDEIARLSHG